MSKIKQFRLYILLVMMSAGFSGVSQTWVDTLDTYARESYLPPSKYMWTWVDAALLNTMVKEYDQSSLDRKPIYREYIRKAMKNSIAFANGRTPNDVASGLGLAFLYRVTKDEKYKVKADKIYAQYLRIKRTKEGAVSHLSVNVELWDDTMFMIGQFLLAMYEATGDEKYIDEFMKQFRQHREKLQDKSTGLWYHGWDSDNKDHCFVCGQTHWPDKNTRQSKEIWGRGNGWIVVTLADALKVVNEKSPYHNEIAGYLKEMIVHLPELQDKSTGHWYQLTARNTEPGNFIESSCTAMFAYGIDQALRQNVVSDTSYVHAVDRAYHGLRQYSIIPKGGKYLTTQNVCVATCIGDKDYYLHRATQKGKPYGIGMAIQFGRIYEIDHTQHKR
jgi:unsaturated rhamnogalacturonyl hydrolase